MGGAVAVLAAVRSAQYSNKMSKDAGAKLGVDNHRQYFNVENGNANLPRRREARNGIGRWRVAWQWRWCARRRYIRLTSLQRNLGRTHGALIKVGR